MEIAINLWKGNTVRDHEALAGMNVWHKLIDLPNAVDDHFDEFWKRSKGICKRGIFAFPDHTRSAVWNYDQLMMLLPQDTGELPFMLDLEKEDLREPTEQADWARELMLRLSVGLGYWIEGYTAGWWWDANIGLGRPEWTWMYPWMICDSRYFGDRYHKKLSELQDWGERLAAGGWTPKLDHLPTATHWQISVDRLQLDEISGDVDLILMRDKEEEKMKLFFPLDEGKGYISQYFGERPNVYPTSRGHNGVDWGLTVANNVYGMQEGEVIVAELRQEKTGYGGQVRIRHPEGVSIYGHLSKVLVKVGDIVQGGQLIGLSGGDPSSPYSGFSTGPHLHAEYRLNSGAPQVPGGFVYNAIDILPLLVSREFAGEEAKPMFTVRTLIGNLTVRRAPVMETGNEIRNAGLGEFTVYEEKNGYGRIHRFLSEWIYLQNPNYVVRVNADDPVQVVKKWSEMTVDEKLEALRERHPEIV